MTGLKSKIEKNSIVENIRVENILFSTQISIHFINENFFESFYFLVLNKLIL